MKIESIYIKNFRSVKETTIVLDDYTCFVGANGVGKSTILSALNIFFRQNKDSKIDSPKLTINDFHHQNTNENIEIKVTFTDLSQAAKESLSHYVRQQDKLVISAKAVFDSNLQVAEVKQYGFRLGFEDFRFFFEKEKEKGTKVDELKKIYKDLQSKYKELPVATTKDLMKESLQAHEAKYPDSCVLIPSEEVFYGLNKGKLDPFVQWVFIAASKDMTEEAEESKGSALGQLLARTVRSQVNFEEHILKLRSVTQQEYQNILHKEQKVLDNISTSLKNRLTTFSHPNIEAQVLWKEDPDKSVDIREPTAFVKIGERGFQGELTRFGHGLQRSFMLALLQELALNDDDKSPTLIMGIEEPEIYQHPPLARHLAETLIDLSENGSQIIICTHSPLFIPGDHVDRIRIVREAGSPSYSTVSSISYEEIDKTLAEAGERMIRESGMIAKLYPTLNAITNEMFFCKTLILVEGIEDVAYISTYFMLKDKLKVKNNIKDFRRLGCHIVQVSGKSNLVKHFTIANLLSIPTFVVFDADTDKINESEIIRHKKDNKALLKLLGHDQEDCWPAQNIVKNNLWCWQFELTKSVENEIEDWKEFVNTSYLHFSNAGDLKKNPLAIAKALELAFDRSKFSQQLLDMTDKIIEFAESKA